MPTHDSSFGQLRALMQSRATLDGPTLLPWLEAARRKDPARYDDVWIPYMAGFSHHWSAPIERVSSRGALERFATLVPFARFIFDGSAWARMRRWREAKGQTFVNPVMASEVQRHGFTDKALADLLESPAISQVVGLDFQMGLISAQGVALLAGCAGLSQLTALNLRANMLVGNQGVTALVSSSYLTRLESLDLSYINADADALCELARSDFGAHLHTLRFLDDVTQQPIAADLIASESLTSLAHLELGRVSSQDVVDILASPVASTLRMFEFTADTAMSVEQVARIASSPHTSMLTALDLCDTALGDAHIRALSEGTGLSALEELALGGNPITSEGVESLVHAPWFHQLTLLDLDQNELDARAFEHLASVPCQITSFTITGEDDTLDAGLARWLAHERSAPLRDLHVECVELRETLHALARATHITQLRELVMRGEEVDEETLSALISSPVVATLQNLDVSIPWTRFPTRVLCEAIASSAHLVRLERLDLSRTSVPDEALVALVGAPQCATLRYLGVEGNAFSDEALVALASSPHLANLDVLRIDVRPHDGERAAILRDSPYLSEQVRAQFDERNFGW